MEIATVVANIDEYCNSHDLTRAEFERKCGISNGLVMNWAKGNYGINLKSLEKIASKTAIPVAKWLEKGAFDDSRKNRVADGSQSSKSA